MNLKGIILENYLSQKRLHMRVFLVTIKDKIRDNAVATQKKTKFKFTVLLTTQQPPPGHTETILNQTMPDGICISPSRRLVTEWKSLIRPHQRSDWKTCRNGQYRKGKAPGGVYAGCSLKSA
jgi:hypothetical protein